MDRETALAELRNAAEKIIYEAYNTNFIEKYNTEFGIESSNEPEEDIKSFMEYGRKISSECFQQNKLSDLVRTGQFIIPVKTREDIRQNNYKIKEECFDYWKYKQMVLDDMISDVLSGEYDQDALLQEIRSVNNLSAEDMIQMEKRAVDMWLEELDVEKYLEILNSIFVDENENRPKIKAENIPAEIIVVQRNKFLTLLNQYREQKGYSEQELRQKSLVTVAVYHNIRHMPETTEYNPTKITVLALCIALHLTLNQAQELLGLLGYSLSKNLPVDRIVAWCLEHQNYNYDVMAVNTVISDLLGKSPFIREIKSKEE